jgi:hypothetical protein
MAATEIHSTIKAKWRGALMFTLIIFACALQPVLAKPLTCGELVDGLDGKGEVNTDYGAILIGAAQTEKPRSCIPNGTVLGVLKVVFIRWTDKHPQQMKTDGWTCAARAFADAYPCIPLR